MENYESLLEAIQAMRNEGYKEDFNLQQDRIECENGRFAMMHHQFKIDKVIRIDVDSDPDEQAILYAISSTKDDIKGILVNAYGVYSNDLTDGMLKKLKL